MHQSQSYLHDGHRQFVQKWSQIDYFGFKLKIPHRQNDCFKFTATVSLPSATSLSPSMKRRFSSFLLLLSPRLPSLCFARDPQCSTERGVEEINFVWPVPTLSIDPIQAASTLSATGSTSTAACPESCNTPHPVETPPSRDFALLCADISCMCKKYQT